MQELIKIAIDQAKESIVIITNHFAKGKEPTIAYANKEFLDLIDYDLSEIIGKNPSIVFDKKNDTVIMNELKETLKLKMSWQGPIVIHSKKKSQKIMYFTIFPVYNFVKEATYYACIGRKIEEQDIVAACEIPVCTHLDNFVNTLFEQSTYLKDINDQLPNGVWRVDKDLNIVYSNCIAQEKFGLNTEKSFFANIIPTEKYFVESMFKNCSKDQKINHMTYRVNNGEDVIWTGCDFWPIIQEDNIIGFAGTMKDVTSEQLLVKQLQVFRSK